LKSRRKIHTKTNSCFVFFSPTRKKDNNLIKNRINEAAGGLINTLVEPVPSLIRQSVSPISVKQRHINTQMEQSTTYVPGLISPTLISAAVPLQSSLTHIIISTVFTGLNADPEDLYQISLLIDQLRHDDQQIRINACKNLVNIGMLAGLCSDSKLL
jgi:hypothetical protein